MASEERESMADRIIRRKNPSTIIPNILASEGKTVVYNDHEITLRYVVAKTPNEWGYQEGAYLVTNVTSNVYQESPEGFSNLFSSNVTVDLLTDMIRGADKGARLTPKYVGPNDGIIFQIS